ncbi:MAG TPA: amidophosphoribosyltransferase [Candidatus Saccharimonadales bacterium]|nr:amidophosphoribosyltransferase [Candidatus Saccharimonadales bacterium]
MAGEQKPAEISAVTEFAALAAIEREDRPEDKCGVVGVFAPGQPVLQLTIAGMEGVQHRGHSGAGIAYVLDNEPLRNDPSCRQVIVHKGHGKVREAIPEIYQPENDTWDFDIARFEELIGTSAAIGHTRYSTAETEDFNALHPHLGRRTGLVLAHNGNIDNMLEIAWLNGYDPYEHAEGDREPTDSELLTHVLDHVAANLGSLEEALKIVLPQLNGAYCLTMIYKGELYAARDAWGFHPLVRGKLKDKGWMVASEQVVLEQLEVQDIEDIAPGEVYRFGKDGYDSFFIDRREEPQLCAFEGIYTAREDGIIDRINVRQMRYNLGVHLGEDQPVDADVVIPVPASGRPCAEGYAAATALPLIPVLEKVKDIRTFLLRGDERDDAIREKYGINPKLAELVRGKRVVLCDDSMIKGHTMRALVKYIRKECGAAEVHVRLSSAQYRKACLMGMDTHDENRLIASRMNLVEMAEYIGADSVAFNTPERLQQAAEEAMIRSSRGARAGKLCTSCVTGKYPFPLPSTPDVFLGIPAVRENAILITD